MSPLLPHLERLHATADAIEQYLDDTAGDLAYIDWDNLNEVAIQARAYANLIHSDRKEAFIEDELAFAERLLSEARQTIQREASR